VDKLFDDMADFWAKKNKETTMLADASNKMVNEAQRPEGEEYTPEGDDMRVQNMGWNTMDLANVSGGVEQNRDLNDGEVVSFYKSLSNLLSELGADE
jgi:hypothetical protein